MVKKIAKKVKIEEPISGQSVEVEDKAIQPIDHIFGNADDNILKDKINEIIRAK